MRTRVDALARCLATVPLLTRQELACCIDLMIHRLDELEGDCDLKAEMDVGVDDCGEEDMAA